MNHNSQQKVWLEHAAKWGITLVALVSVAGCGGSSSSSRAPDDNPPITETTSVSGRVADGYIQGATVCLDLNDNRRCDTGEPTATSGKNGVFNIAGVTPAQVKDHVIVAVIPPGAIDEDNPGQPINSKYVLSGTQGRPDFVSPLTTMIQARLETTPSLTTDEAATHLAQQLGMDSDADLLGDYVEKKKSDKRYQRAHSVAQVVAAVLAKNHSEVEEAAGNIDAEAKSAALQRIVVNAAAENLETIVAKVEAAENNGDNINPEDVASAPEFSVETENLDQAIEQEELNASHSAASVREILEDGFNEFMVEGEPLEYEQIRMWLDPADPNKAIHRFSLYTEGTGWGELEDEGGETRTLWIDGTWQDVVRPKDLPVEFLDNGRARLSFSEGDDVLVHGSWVDLEGRTVEAILKASAYYEGLPDLSGARFPKDAKGVRFNMSEAQDFYSISHWNPDDYGCDEVVEQSGNCNALYHHGPLHSLDQLFLGEDAESVDLIEVGDSAHTIYLTLEGTPSDTEGKAVFELREDESTFYEASWRRVTLAEGHDVILVRKPVSIRPYTSSSDTPYVLFAVHDGYVRRGNHIPKGTMEFESGIWFFNDVAMKAILKSLGMLDGNPFYSNP